MFRKPRHILKSMAQLRLRIRKKHNTSLKSPYVFKTKNLQQKFGISSIDELLRERLLDIVVSSKEHFSGDSIIQETMTYQAFNQYDGPLTLYMAQIPIEAKLPFEILSSDHDYKMQIWCSKGFTDSGWHYDSYHNYLSVLEGTKIVFLRKKCNWSQFNPATEDNYNHMIRGQMQSKFVIINKNDTLFIPKGMFHRVISFDNTIGINIWFDSIENTTIQIKEHHFRYLANELLWKKIKYECMKYSKRVLKHITIKKEEENIIKQSYQINKVHKRTKHSKTYTQQIIIYICILMSHKSHEMVQFINSLNELNELIKLPSMIKLMIVVKLDEFAENTDNIVLRENLYQRLQVSKLGDDLHTNKLTLSKQICRQMIHEHFQF